MKIAYTEEFKKEFRKLPAGIERIYRLQEQRFRTNWRDPRLHLKKLKGDRTTFSFRITRSYRLLPLIFHAPAEARFSSFQRTRFTASRAEVRVACERIMRVIL